MARKSTDIVKLQVRLPERLRRRLEQMAKHHDWSMNTEIVNRLDESFQKEEQDKMITLAIEQAVEQAASVTAARTVAALKRLSPKDAPRLPAAEHPASIDKEEKLK
jgi:hypothetical protein